MHPTNNSDRGNSNRGNSDRGKLTLREIVRSPGLLAILAAGVILVVGVPYLALQTLPGINNPVTEEASAPTGNPNLGINFEELNNLPEEIAANASVILAQEEPILPETLMDLPEPSGFGLTHPVTEAVETPQPVLSWTLFSPGPYKITVRDQAGMEVVSVQNQTNLSLFLPGRLQPGGIYTWRVTAANSEYEEASFVILTPEQVGLWQNVRRQFPQSHLALGLAAESLGMLTAAEREYQELGKQFPNAEAPARLLGNVLALRE